MTIPPNTSQRLQSLDVYRGATMLFMASDVMGITRVAHAWGNDNGFWRFVEFQLSHVPWTGWSAWDMIQPSFMFMAGVALPWSLASRLGRGDKPLHLWLHALWRSFLLVALGIFLRSVGKPQTYFTFEDVLTQIGLGYPILFALGFTKPRVQAMAAGAILLGYWALFALFPAPGPDYPWTSVGVPANWPHHLQGFAAHWDKNSNPAHFADVWFLNLFPREKPFLFNSGGYMTLNFVPSLATMIFGLLAGGVLRSGVPDRIRKLVTYGIAGVALGWVLDLAGIAPMVKRIWSPGWTIFAGGFTTLLLAGFYWLVDVKMWRNWAFPFLVVGMNSIAMYVLSHLIDRFIADSLRIHLGQGLFEMFGAQLAPVVMGTAVLGILWLILYWMYQRKLFLRL